MKTPLRLSLVACLALSLSLLQAEPEAPAEEPTVRDVTTTVTDPGAEKPREVTTRYHVLTEAQLRARVLKPLVCLEPDWFLFVPPEDKRLANEMRRIEGTNDKRRRWERQADEFANWIRNRVEAGSVGRKKERPTITLTQAEFLTLCVDPAGKYRDVLAKWANGAGPGANLDKDLGGAIQRVELTEKPTEAELAFAERMREVRRAYAAFRKGDAQKMDIEALRAFVAAMK